MICRAQRARRAELVLRDDWLALRQSGKRADHVLQLRPATRLRSTKRQSGMIVRHAVIGARFTLDGDTPVLAARLIVSGLIGGRCGTALGKSVRFNFGEERLPIRRSFQLGLADRADPAVFTKM